MHGYLGTTYSHLLYLYISNTELSTSYNYYIQFKCTVVVTVYASGPQNDLQEFYSIVEFCNPGVLGEESTSLDSHQQAGDQHNLVPKALSLCIMHLLAVLSPKKIPRD